MSPDRIQLEELSRQECLDLLGSTRFGRVVVTTAQSGVPVIRPVNYVFDAASQSVAFRTGEGSKFHALVHSAQACFEIDDHDAGTRSGWSVIIAGRTEEVTQVAEIERLDRLGLVMAAGGSRAHWMRIRARTVSGRRITPAAH
jgi:nitroimidazol reductase NimA-like FMN-containing flavoprotein (pyridoxamine 5'-phosphate oxidase superfamily)